MASAIQQFINTHPVFTGDEFRAALGGSRTEHTLRTQIKYYRDAGRIGQVKPGLYYRQSTGSEESRPDKYLVGSKIAPDAVLGYHSAFEALGYAHSVSSRVYILTAFRRRPFTFQDVDYRPVAFPTLAEETANTVLGLTQVERAGEKIPVTGKERSLVDGLDRPEYMGGYEEMRRCIEKIPYLDCDILTEYLQLRNKKILFAKVGFVLERFQEEWFVDEAVLTRLESHIPQSPAYFGAEHSGTMVNRWNLIVPDILLQDEEVR